MKTHILSAVLLLISPAFGAHLPFNVQDARQTVLEFGRAHSSLSSQHLPGASEWLDEAKKVILKGKKNLEKWYYQGREYIKQDNLMCELFGAAQLRSHWTPWISDEFVTHPDFTSYDLRVTEPKLCDPSVKQYSGYLDVADDKHLFFWWVNGRLWHPSVAHTWPGSLRPVTSPRTLLSCYGWMVDQAVAHPLVSSSNLDLAALLTMARTQRLTLTVGLRTPTSFSLINLSMLATLTPTMEPKSPHHQSLARTSTRSLSYSWTDSQNTLRRRSISLLKVTVEPMPLTLLALFTRLTSNFHYIRTPISSTST